MKKNKTVLVLIVIMILTLSFVLAGCVDYCYNFHLRVVSGNGKIIPEDSNWYAAAELCSTSPDCVLDCAEGSQIISRMGSKKGCTMTFFAIPDEGYRVKEWRFNGKVVEGNKTSIYIAKVTKNDNNGVIEVVFEKRPEN